MYWIYGGSLQFGNAGQGAYDGSWFAANEDVVVVTVNYRTNGALLLIDANTKYVLTFRSLWLPNEPRTTS